MKHTTLSIIRHALTYGGGYLTGKGLISDDTLKTLIPLVITAVGALWGAVDEYLAARAAKKGAVS